MTDDQQLSMGLPSPQDLTTVGDYQFEPIKGYPMLHWKGKRPFTSTQFYPAQLKEVHGEAIEDWHNKIYWGDNLQVMSHLLKEFRGKVDLVYIDPPFDSKADYRRQIEFNRTNVSNNLTAFEEKQYEDIWSNDEYLQFMYERLILIKELLSQDGSIYLHCDWHRIHYLKCIMDEVFGIERFGAEIVWQRGYAHANATKKYGSIHDSILFYTASEEFIWNQQYVAYPEEYIKTFFDQVDENGKKYARIDLTASMSRASASQVYEWRGITPPPSRCWAKLKDKMDALESAGKIHWPKKEGGMPRLKQYPEDLPGVPVQDTWTDLRPMHNLSSERLGYPTQKPEALLERIIQTSSNKGDLIFDCFMGSGTTQSVAMKLGRKFIGADINLGAVQISTKRLLGLAAELKQPRQGRLQVDNEILTTHYPGFEVYNVNHYDVFRNPIQAKDLLIEALELNPLERSNLFDGEKDGRLWKIMPVNRITTRADLNELIAGFDYKAFQKRHQEHPHKAVEKITLVSMGHDPDLASVLKQEVKPFVLDVEVVDILRDKQEIQFKRDSEAQVSIKGSELVIETFYPMNLLAKLSLQQENVEDWRELVESVMIDWNYDGAILEPKQVDIPDKNELVKGRYSIPDDAGTIRIKITDLLSESLEMEVQHG